MHKPKDRRGTRRVLDSRPRAGVARTGAPSEQDVAIARFIAIVIRNAMEDFHVGHLSDVQMRQLNPLIRNAIFTALHAARHMARLPGAKAFVECQTRLIPSYWEAPQLLHDYLEVCEMENPSVNVGDLKKAPRRAAVGRPSRRSTSRR